MFLVWWGLDVLAHYFLWKYFYLGHLTYGTGASGSSEACVVVRSINL